MYRFVLTALLCLMPGVAGANAYLDEGKRLYAQLQYSQAIDQLRVAREVPNATRSEKVEAMDLLARCLIAESQREEAGRVYADLLTFAPGAQLDAALSPKIREVFDEAKRRLYPDGYTALRRLPAAPGVVVYARTGESWRELQLAAQEGWLQATFGAQGEEATAWYAEALGPDGVAIAQLGSRAAPFMQGRPELTRQVTARSAPAEPRLSQAQRIAGGVAVGAAVLAASAGGIMQYRSSTAEGRARDPDVWVDEGAAWHARADSDAK